MARNRSLNIADECEVLGRRLLVIEQMFVAASHDRSGEPFSNQEASDMYYGLAELLQDIRRDLKAIVALDQDDADQPSDGRR
jgi:hypothetical protein